MKQYIPTYTDISAWQINIHLNTGGSRSKKIAINPTTEEEYFFKGSKELPTGEIRYPMEFWSEIISSKIGQYLGFNMLDYNIGFNLHDKQQVGCLSKSMVEYSENNLTEGKAYLTGFNPKYNPLTDKADYTFQFIRDSLKYFNLEKSIEDLVEVIIFDAIISNSDRHQENWGFITYFKEAIESIEYSLKNEKLIFWKRFLLKYFKNIFQKMTSLNVSGRKSLMMMQSTLPHNVFSPIYDSGCCLGREKEDKVVKELLIFPDKLNSYIRKGFSEIYWEGSIKKKRHFELVALLKEEYPKRVNSVIARVKERFNIAEIREIIENIDNHLPANLFNSKLSDDRKELMIKIITLRFERLIDLE